MDRLFTFAKENIDLISLLIGLIGVVVSIISVMYELRERKKKKGTNSMSHLCTKKDKEKNGK